MINIAVCDDELYMRKELSLKIKNYFSEEKVSVNIIEFSNGTSLLKCQKEFDIIFLDIQMENLNGMETAQALRNQEYKGFLIFVTILNEYVYDSFEVQAYDYLIKPIEDNRFRRTMKRLLFSIQKPCNTHLLIQKENDYMIIPFDDILFCEVINRKIYIHLIQNKMIDYYDKIENLEKKLNKSFFRCHRSYLINLKYIHNYQKNIAYLKTGDTIPVSRLRKQDFSNAILEYMKEGRYKNE